MHLMTLDAPMPLSPFLIAVGWEPKAQCNHTKLCVLSQKSFKTHLRSVQVFVAGDMTPTQPALSARVVTDLISSHAVDHTRTGACSTSHPIPSPTTSRTNPMIHPSQLLRIPPPSQRRPSFCAKLALPFAPHSSSDGMPHHLLRPTRQRWHRVLEMVRNLNRRTGGTNRHFISGLPDWFLYCATFEEPHLHSKTPSDGTLQKPTKKARKKPF